MEKQAVAGSGSKLAAFFSPKLLHFALLFLLSAGVGVGGIELTNGSFADQVTPYGHEIITVHENTLTGPLVSGVTITTQHNGGTTTCEPNGQDTNGSGRLDLKCQAGANGAARTYNIAAKKSGWHISGNSAHRPETGTMQFRVSKGDSNDFTLVMDKDPSAAAPSSTATTSGGASGGTASVPSGAGAVGVNGKSLVFLVVDNSDKPLKDVTIILDGVGSHGCTNPSDLTRQTDASGHATFSGCDPGGNVFTIKSFKKAGYQYISGFVHNPPDQLNVYADRENDVNLKLAVTPVATPTPTPTPTSTSKPSTSSATPGAAAAPTPTTQPTPTNSSPTETQKNGSITVTGRLDKSSFTPLNGMQVSVAAYGYDAQDAAHDCADPTKTTGANGSVDFGSCWSGSKGEAYYLKSLRLPIGYKFQSLKIVGPTGAVFLGGQTSSQNTQQIFNVPPNTTVKLEVVVSHNTELSTQGVKQVVTPGGKQFVAATNSPLAKANADELNKIFPNGTVGLANVATPDTSNGEKSDNSVDLEPPSEPHNLKAYQDESGSINLTWNASKGNPTDEDVTYDVQRSVKGSSDEPEDLGITTDTSWLDDSDTLVYPQTYIYTVTASDDSNNVSGATRVEITTSDPVANIQPGNSAGHASENGVENNNSDNAAADDQGGGDVGSDDGMVDASFTGDDTDQALACAISTDDSTGSDLLNPEDDIYTPVCRDDSGDTVDQLDGEVDLSVTGDGDLQAYDGTDWQQLPTSGSRNVPGVGTVTVKKTTKNGKTQYQVKTKKLFTFALTGHRRTAAPAAVPLFSLLSLVIFVVGARFLIRRKLESQFVVPYGDIDLIPHELDEAGPSNGAPLS